MSDVLALVFPFFGLVLLGFVVARAMRIPMEGMAWMNAFIVYVALPPLFFVLLADTPVEDLTNWRFILATTLSTFLIFVATLIPAWVINRDVGVGTVQALGAAYGNIGYMAPGIALLAFGERAAVPVALIFCFDNAMHFINAPLLMALRGGGGGSPIRVIGRALWQVISHPFIIATLVGVSAAVWGWRPPLAIERMVDSLAGAAAPCALFAMGVTLALRPVERFPPALLAIVPIKLIVAPMLVFVLLGWFGPFDPVWVQAAVLIAALPTATNVYVIAQQYDVWVNRASATVLVTTMASVVTVTALLYGMRNDWFPLPEMAADKSGRLVPGQDGP